MDVEFKGDFFKHLKKVNRPTFLRQLTTETGAIAVNFSKQRFRDKNWVNRGRESWEQRKRKERKGSLMVKSGRLKRSVRKISQGSYYVLIGTDVPYAQIHNEGGTINETVKVKAHKRVRNIYALRKRRKAGQSKYTTKKIGSNVSTVKAHTRQMKLTMPRRQFLGESQTLLKALERYMYKQLMKKLK